MTPEEIRNDIKKMANMLRDTLGTPDADVAVGMPVSVAVEAELITQEEGDAMKRDGQWTYGCLDKVSE